MDYKTVYDKAFSVHSYSSEHHIQYDWVIEELEKIFKPDAAFSLIDVGSGRGHVLKMIHKHFPQAQITSTDLNNYHNLDFVSFLQCDVTKKADRDAIKDTFDILINLDFLEHIEKQHTAKVISFFGRLAPRALIAIANHSDVWNGVELHVVQENIDWWSAELEEIFTIQDKKSHYNNRLFLFVVKK